MEEITKEDVIRIARLSHITIHEEELERVQEHLKAILNYAQRVKDIAKDVDLKVQKNTNVFRQDVIIKTEPEPIRGQAPERASDYFVVPIILEGGQ